MDACKYSETDDPKNPVFVVEEMKKLTTSLFNDAPLRTELNENVTQNYDVYLFEKYITQVRENYVEINAFKAFLKSTPELETREAVDTRKENAISNFLIEKVNNGCSMCSQ